MSYAKYLEGLKSSLVLVSRAKKSGVVLSRFEEFDNMFKKELAICEGLRRDHKLAFKLVSNINNVDFRVACLYAEAFSSVVDLVKDGYFFADVIGMFKDAYYTAKSKYIYAGKLSIDAKDKNSVLTIEVKSKKGYHKEYSVNTPEDMVVSFLSFVSYLGSCDEETREGESWFEEYLIIELNKIINGYKATPYVDEKKIVGFKSYLDGNNIETDEAKDEIRVEKGKVLHLADYTSCN